MDKKLKSGKTYDKNIFCKRVEEFLKQLTKVKTKKNNKK